MLVRAIRFLLACAAVLLLSASAGAQVIPTPAQAQQMLRNDPGLIGRLQQMMQSSGMTPDQVRARLKAAGYPDSLLNQYLPGAATRPDSTSIPDDEVFSAVRRLGIGDTLVIDSLSAAARSRRRVRTKLDSAFLDTLQLALRNDTTLAAVRALLASREAQRLQVDSGFTIYGLELFESQTSQFDANVMGGVDPSYRFGSGDVLNLILSGDVQQSYRLTVTRDGMVQIPDVGLVNVAGMTRSQLDEILYTRLGAVYSGVQRGPGARTRFLVDVAQMGRSQVFVNGDVVRPNSYVVSRASTVMTALYHAGGPTENGSMRDVQINRNGRTIATLDIYDVALRGDASRDVRLESGDIVFVPSRGPRVRVAGAVLRPRQYETKPGETLGQLLRWAGGLNETADRRRIQIERIVPPAERTTSGRDRIVLDVAPERIESEIVRGGDVIRVFQIARRVSNRVTVKGNVWSPGVVGLTPGMTLFDALRRAGGLKPDSYKGDVLVTRMGADSTSLMLRTAVLDTVGHPANNFALADGDEITVYSTTELRSDRYITVGGAVRKPGEYIKYREGMTLRDAVLMAGGLQEGALLTDVEVARLPSTRGSGVVAVSTTVSLDSTYIFERGADGRLIIPAGVVVPTTPAPQVLLEPYDAIQIKWQPDWQLQQKVALRGEVKSPGDYSLLRTTERLSELLARAGGLTSAAYAGGVVFIRKRDQIGRIGVDLPAVLRNSQSVDNLQLVDGDSIFIPKFSQVVTVRGAVHSQVGVAYVEGASLDYYIRSAGGATVKGDRRRAYVTQPNGKVETSHRKLLLWTSTPRPHPGSTVVVPERDPSDRRDWLQIATATTSLLGSLVAVAAIVRR